MKKLTIIDQIALATTQPELFDKKHLQDVLKIKDEIYNTIYKNYK